MANIAIPNLPPVVALSGSEQIEVVQNGSSARATVAQVSGIQYATYTVAQLLAFTPTAPSRAWVSNGVAAPSFGNAVGATGAQLSPVYYDGANWRYG